MNIPFRIALVAGLLLIGAGCTGASRPAPTGGTVQDRAVAQTSTRLDLSGQGLTKVPAYVFERTELTALDVSDNALTGALQAEIRHLRNLQALDASGNRMTGVPAEIGQLSSLRDLDLSENELTGLPLELGNLVDLRRLDLRGNDISKQDLDAIRAKLTGTEILE